MTTPPRQLASRCVTAGLLVALALAVIALAREPRALGLAWTTLRISLAVVAVSLPAGVVLAILLARTRLPGRSAFYLAWCVLLFLPLYLQTSAWDAGFGQQGWYSLERGELTHPWLAGERAVVWIHGLAAIPWVMLIVGQGLRQVNPDLEEVALLDASPGWVLATVTLRQALPSVLAAAIVVGVLTAGEMSVTDVYRVRTYAEELYTNAALTTDAVEMTVGIWPQVALVAVLVALGCRGALWLMPPGDRTPHRALPTFEWGIARWLACACVAVMTLVAVGVPLANLVYKAGFTVDMRTGTPVEGWTWERFADSTFPEQIDPGAWRFAAEYRSTLAIAVATATLTALLAIVLAWLAREGTARATPAVVAAALGLAIPGPLVALGVIWLLNRPEPALLPWLYDRTIVPPVLAITVKTLPLATLVLWWAFRSLDQDQLDAARVDGGSEVAVLWRVALGQRWPAVAVAWLGSFALAAGDLTASILVIPPGMTTVANQIFLLIHAGVHNQEAGLCLAQAALFTAIACAVLWLAGKGSPWRDLV